MTVLLIRILSVALAAARRDLPPSQRRYLAAHLGHMARTYARPSDPLGRPIPLGRETDWMREADPRY